MSKRNRLPAGHFLSSLSKKRRGPLCEALEARQLLSALPSPALFRTGGTGSYTNTPIDDVYISSYTPDTIEGGGVDAAMQTRNTGTINDVELVGIKNMMNSNMVPPTDASGNPIVISQAILHLWGYTGSGANPIHIFRATSNWLGNAAGSNQTNVTWNHAGVSPSQNWVSAPPTGFSSADYTTTDGVAFSFNTAPGQENDIDVTGIVKDMYATNGGAGQNDGFVISSDTSSLSNMCTSEHWTVADRPCLEIQFSYAAPTTYTLNVHNDTGVTGGTFHAGDQIPVTAHPSGGNLFDLWTGIANSDLNSGTVNSPSIDLTMPSHNVDLWENNSPALSTTTSLSENQATIWVDNGEIHDWSVNQNENSADSSSFSMEMRGTTNNPYFASDLLGFENLFNGSNPQTGLVPLQDSAGHPIHITSATLHLDGQGGSGTVYVDRMATDPASQWLINPAPGKSETDITFAHRQVSTGAAWKNGNFSTADYTTTHEASAGWSPVGDNAINVTGIVQDMYADGVNNGFLLRAAAGSDVSASASESPLSARRPYLTITYDYSQPTPIHSLTLQGGSDAEQNLSGNAPHYYWQGEPVLLNAGSPPAGQIFNLWSGDVGNVTGVQTLTDDVYNSPQMETFYTTPLDTNGNALAVVPGSTFSFTLTNANNPGGETWSYTAVSGDTPQSVGANFVNQLNGDGDFRGVNPGKFNLKAYNYGDATFNIVAQLDPSRSPESYAKFTCTAATTNQSGAHLGPHFSARADHTKATTGTLAVATNDVYTMPGKDATVTATWRDQGASWHDAAGGIYDWYPVSLSFDQANFGATKEPMAYDFAGTHTLAFESNATKPGATWTYWSRNSADISFVTNLPAIGQVQYCDDAYWQAQHDYNEFTEAGASSNQAGRYLYIHNFTLSGLNPATTYHFHYTATDEANVTIDSAPAGDQSGITLAASPPNVTLITGPNSDTPSVWYTCDANQPNTTYILCTDVVTNGGAFEIAKAGVTLDLNGHKVVYNNATNTTLAATDPDDRALGGNSPFLDPSQASFGVHAKWQNGVSVLNGQIVQGLGYNYGHFDGEGFNPVLLVDDNGGQVAGVYTDYMGGNLNGIEVEGSSHIHNNVVLDRSSEITDRQQGNSAITGAYEMDHNEVLRARHRGVFSTGVNGTDDAHRTSIHDNEVYVDSVCTNSLGVGVWDDQWADIYHNRVFVTGYNVQGVVVMGGSQNVNARDNYVVGIAAGADYRFTEYGVEGNVAGLRATFGGSNITFDNNYSALHASGAKANDRGIWSYQDQTESPTDVFVNLTFSNNTIATTRDDDNAVCYGAVDLTGDGKIMTDGSGNMIPGTQVLFVGNTLESNYRNLSLGTDPYGSGSNSLFEHNTLMKLGNRGDYHTIQIGSGIPNIANVFYDTVCDPGTSLTDVQWSGTLDKSQYYFYVGYTLHITTQPGATVQITDPSQPGQTWTGTADANGLLGSSDFVRSYMVSQDANGATLQTAQPFNIKAYYGGAWHELDDQVLSFTDTSPSITV